MLADEILFEDAGWSDTYYRDTSLFVWEHPNYPGLLIDASDEKGEKFVILAGDPRRKARRITEFDDAGAAMRFCERIVPLADWLQAADRSGPAPAGLVQQLHQIALDVTK